MLKASVLSSPQWGLKLAGGRKMISGIGHNNFVQGGGGGVGVKMFTVLQPLSMDLWKLINSFVLKSLGVVTGKI